MLGKKYKLNPGDGAFYGPKLDLKIKDAIKLTKILKGNMAYFELDDETAEKDINFATYIFLNGIIIK